MRYVKLLKAAENNDLQEYDKDNKPIMEFISATKDMQYYGVNHKVNKATYIIPFKNKEGYIQYVYIPNKQLLKKFVRENNVNTNFLCFSFDEGKYWLGRIEHCI